ncbi:sensor histidine kinase [Hymenobacter psychrotolerans]|uniref:histidine kinase n=1 Tax=Hymenobacter psychrotolerans DSM 18569 TaxID=1121959 RepID=A0A1M7DZN4_9BACT|nr:PAS domain-containing protein [Hymenobacter psychrotolerans]SHL84944.1 PAS domain S-box-containing protein [Hymenobacter psychrotolerans DSM 18569]
MYPTISLLSVFRALPDATLLLSAELRIEAVSNSYLAATLTRREDLLGHCMFEVFPDNPATPEAHSVRNLRASLEQVLATRQPHIMLQQRYDVPDPSRPGQFVERHWLPRNTPILDEQGRVSHILHSVSDVTLLAAGLDRHQATSAELLDTQQQLRQVNRELEARVAERTRAQHEALAALRESETRFRIMADAAPNQVWAVNPDSTIRYANQAFLDFVGVSLEEYVATGWSAYLPPQELQLAQHTLTEAIRTRSQYRLEHRMRRHDGQYRWLLAQAAPSFYPNGDLYGYVGSAIDITDLKQANEQLTRTNQGLDNFVYAASHDLKQPVNNLAGLFEEMRRSSTFADAAEEQLLVPLVHEALQQLSITIDDLAALGQAQQFSQTHAELVSLDDLTEDVVNTLEPQVRVARARITTDFQAWPALSFARANLRTILLNLLGNSLKYADPARAARIHVSMWVEQGRPVLVVEDNGLGFDAEKHGTELFHLFRRLHTHIAGTGVGLYLVYRIVEANGGSIEVDSQPGEGATFRIRFGTA